MSDFEKIHEMEPMREKEEFREKNPYIELHGEQYVAQFVYKPIETENMSEIQKEKFELAKELCKETKILDIRSSHERIESKITKKRIKKDNSRSHKSAMEKV